MFKQTTNTWSFKNPLNYFSIFKCFPQEKGNTKMLPSVRTPSYGHGTIDNDYLLKFNRGISI